MNFLEHGLDGTDLKRGEGGKLKKGGGFFILPDFLLILEISR